MIHELECPLCKFKFTEDEDYVTCDCPNCKQAYYYWDYTLVEEDDGTLEEYFSGYYWQINKT